MADESQQTSRIPLVEERLVVAKRDLETGKVRIRTVVDHEFAHYTEQLHYQKVQVERVAIDRDVEVAPDIRQDGDTLIIPVVEEYVFMEKRLRLKEELHVRTVRGVEHVADTIPVRRMRAIVERTGPRDKPPRTGDDHDPHDHRPL